MREEIIEILKKDLTNEEKAEAIFNFANMVQQANIIQMLSFAEWASKHFIILKEFWIAKSKSRTYNKDQYTTNDLFGIWLKVRGTENENL